MNIQEKMPKPQWNPTETNLVHTAILFESWIYGHSPWSFLLHRPNRLKKMQYSFRFCMAPLFLLCDSICILRCFAELEEIILSYSSIFNHKINKMLLYTVYSWPFIIPDFRKAKICHQPIFGERWMEVKQRRNYPLPIWSFSPVPIPLSSSFILAIPMFSLLPNSLFCLSSHSFFSLLILFIVPASNIQMFFRFHDSLAMLSPYHKAMKTSSFPSHLPQHNRHPLFHHHDTIMYPYLVFLYEMFQNEVWL